MCNVEFQTCKQVILINTHLILHWIYKEYVFYILANHFHEIYNKARQAKFKERIQENRYVMSGKSQSTLLKIGEE